MSAPIESTGTDPSGTISVSPSSGSLDYSNPGADNRLSFELKLRDKDDLHLSGASVEFIYSIQTRDDSRQLVVDDGCPNPLDIGFGVLCSQQEWSPEASTTYETDDNGVILFWVWLDSSRYTEAAEGDVLEVTASAEVDGGLLTIMAPISLVS
jgi:hypothetical protein